MRRVHALCAAVLCGLSVAAYGHDIQLEEATITRGQGWSTLGGRTSGSGATVLSAELGWPGISLQGLHGLQRELDLGGRFTFNYAFEDLVTTVNPGIKLQAVARYSFFDQGKLSLAAEFAPGPLFYFPPSGTLGGITLPVGVALGVSVSSALYLNLGLDVPFSVIFGSFGGIVFPILVGGGAEYFIDRKLAVSFNTRMGPAISTRFAVPSTFAFEALLGVAYKL